MRISKSIGVMFIAILLIQSGDSGLAQQHVPFSHDTIDPKPPNNPWFKMTGDISGDGLPDIVVGGSKGPLIAYVYPDWKKMQLADDGWDGVNGEIGDLDGDGDQDIVMGGVIWFENPGVMGEPWMSRRLDNLRAHDIELADLDGDGRMDVVARDQSAFGKKGNKIYMYYQRANDVWNRQVFDCPHGEGLKLGDIDRDGDADIVIGGRWYENPRNATARWIERRYTDQWTEPDAKVELADINGDSRPDIVLTPAELKGETYNVCWYEAPTDPKSSDWPQHVITGPIECVIHALGIADIDGDGDMDVAIAEMHQGADPDEVRIYFNDGRGLSWSTQILSTKGSHDIVLADIGGDGDIDIVGANHGGPYQPIEMWLNLSKESR